QTLARVVVRRDHEADVQAVERRGEIVDALARAQQAKGMSVKIDGRKLCRAHDVRWRHQRRMRPIVHDAGCGELRSGAAVGADLRLSGRARLASWNRGAAPAWPTLTWRLRRLRRLRLLRQSRAGRERRRDEKSKTG